MEFFNPRNDIELSRHRLSHWSQGRVPVFVTFRLSDSLPKEVYEAWLEERKAFILANPLPWDDEIETAFHSQFSVRIDEQLDAAHGCCALRDPRVAEIVAERLQHFDGTGYQLLNFVVMPNHVHVLFTLAEGRTLPETLKAWKGVSSRLIHREGLCDLNPFWQPDYFDRLIRGPEHLEKTYRYIQTNPAMAGLTSGFVYWEAAL